MISIDSFKSIVRQEIGYDLDNNDAQREVIAHDNDDVLMIVAGPGSGKTAVLVLRALRHVFVDDILPEKILITTFTRKAAKELRTRWINWGLLLLNHLQNNPNLREQISRIDLNRCRIDTLDSIAQQALTENKLPGEIAPVVLEGYASKLILKRFSFSQIYFANKTELDSFFSRYTRDGRPPSNQGKALEVAKTLCERLIQDRVNLDSYGRVSDARQLMMEIHNEYLSALRERNLFDFATLELELLNRLQNETIQAWVNDINALLIDEYQDTNPLQEAIYFEIISLVSPKVTMVGDDDQAMYRFRGGSVELFTQFSSRCLNATGRATRRIDMINNYRSSSEIVHFYNSHITRDPCFADARITPAKPEVVSIRGSLEMPILGLFRDGKDVLADALAELLHGLIVNRRKIIPNNGTEYEINLTDEGDLGDFVFLAHTIEEVKYNRFNVNAEEKFPWYLRNAMLSRGLRVFNPRGRALRSIRDVQQLLGLILLCIDPDCQRTNQTRPTREAGYFLDQWRNAASALIDENPLPGGIHTFVNEWQKASLGQHNRFPSDWPVLELVYKLITWLPTFQNNPEHQVWLEAITRSISSAGMVSPYGMQLYQANPHRERSRESFIRDALLPIAENEVEVDEDIMPSVPRNWLQLMTIHQAKGLEFPVTIVDVGSRFSRNHHTQALLRFPRDPSNVVLMEDDVEPHLEGPLRSGRTPIDRSFDDLIRLYYVAYSRPMSVLMLVGDEKCLTYGRGRNLTNAIPNMALGWNRDGTWPWRQPFTGRRTPVLVDAPFILI
ncbi:MAG: ATP-dependent helicase [Clostridia bacterium]|nr:ATP-dependent helicase [Clostridia bacterium]